MGRAVVILAPTSGHLFNDTTYACPFVPSHRCDHPCCFVCAFVIPYEDLYSVYSHCRLERRFLGQFVMISVLNGATGKISFTRSRFECKTIETPGFFALSDFVASPSDWG